MKPIKRLEYDNRTKKNADFEISDLQHFFETRPISHLIRDYRLNFWVIIYITEGDGNHSIDFTDYLYKAGDMIILKKNQVHHFQVSHKVQGYIMIFNEPFFFENNSMSSKNLLDFFNNPLKSPVQSINNQKDRANRILIDLIYAEYTKWKGEDKEFYIRSLIQSFIYSLDDFSQEDKLLFSSPEFQTYNKFHNLLEENYKTMKAVDDYAALMNVSKKTINSATRTVVGLSAKEFIIERIILEIKRYISLGDLLTYEISEFLGFDEPSNMAKFFKRYVGMTPSAFKESLK